MASKYFEAQAADVFGQAGGDPANSRPLATWAEDARVNRDWRRLGVIVAQDGTLIAETIRLNVLVPRHRPRRRATTPDGGRVDGHGGPQARSGGRRGCLHPGASHLL